MTEDIITALSRISALWVIARTSTFTYKDKPTDVKRVARELGVRYVMEGSVRRVGDRLRVTAQLIDAATGRHLWAERYDRSLADLFDIQDEITRSVAASVELQVELAELQAAESRPSTDFKARDLVARAAGRIYDQTSEAIAEASDFVEEAIRIDPLTPRAHQMRGTIFLNRMYLGEIPHDAANIGRALELARTALRLAPRDEWAHWLMAGAYAEAGQLEDAVAECELGLEINPNCSAILQRLGAFLGPLGRPQEAIKACRLAIQLDPRNPLNYWRHSHIAIAHFVATDYEAALQESKRVARSRPHLQSAIIWAASAAALGKADEARTAVENCLLQRPDLRVGRVPGIVTRFCSRRRSRKAGGVSSEGRVAGVTPAHQPSCFREVSCWHFSEVTPWAQNAGIPGCHQSAFRGRASGRRQTSFEGGQDGAGPYCLLPLVGAASYSRSSAWIVRSRKAHPRPWVRPCCEVGQRQPRPTARRTPVPAVEGGRPATLGALDGDADVRPPICELSRPVN